MTGVIAGATAFGGLAGLASTAAHATSSFTPTNVYGANRYQSAGMSNEKAFPSGVGTVVLADGLPGHQGDALAASGYAGVNGDGIILTDNTNTVPADTMTALSTLKVKTIQPVGGTAAISSSQLAALTAAGYTVKPSLAGATSLGTMQAIDDSIAPSSVGTSSSGLPTAFLASVDANHLVDALSAGGGAFALKFPVITTETTSSTLSPQAQQVITTLGIKKLIVLGGTASVPASQYSPNPSGVTTEDTSATTGADRSTTSTLLGTDLSKNYSFDTPLTSMILAAGATFVGSTTALQNDGADALADAPLGGITKSVTIVTNGPTDIGQAGNFATANASTLDPLFVGTGPANLPTSQVNTVVTDGGGSGGPSANTYSVSPAPSLTPLTPTASTASAPNQGVETYTVSGLPGGSTPVDIALFPCTGTAQTGNGPTNGAPGVNSSGGATFTAPGGTSPVAGSAIGEGTTSANAAGNTHPTTAPAAGATAYIATVNGVPTPGTTTEYVAPAATSVTFVLNSWSPDCTIPIVYTVPSSQSQTVGSTSPAPLLVNANGSPQSGYAVGEGQASYWQAPAAPATAGSAEVYVLSVSPSTNSFQGCSNATLSAGCFTYSYAGGSAFYTDGLPISLTSFGSDLSGPVLTNLPNTTTAQAVPEDLVFVGGHFSTPGGLTTTGYNPSGGSAFQFDATHAFAFGDVPAAPAGTPSASFNGCATLSGTTCVPGNVLTWTASANQDMSGTEATANNSTVSSAGNASYTVFKEQVTGTTFGAPSSVGTVTVVGSNWTGVTPTNLPGGNTSVSSPQIIDTTISSGASYVYYVVPTAASSNNVSGDPNGGGNSGPASATSNQVTSGAGATAPVMKYAIVTPSTAFTAFTGTAPAGSYTATGGAPGSLTIVYNEAVTCLGAAGSDFTYSNSGGTGSVSGTQCWQVPGQSSQLVISLAQVTKSGSGSTATFSQTTVANPGNGDTVTYTPASPQTTANSVFAGTTSSPAYAASQTLTGNGSGAASTSNPVGTGTGAPLMGSATHTASTIVILYNQTPICPATTGSAADWSGSALGGQTVLTCGVTGKSITLTLTGASAAGSLTYTSPATPTTSNAVSDPGGTEFSPGNSSDTQTMTVS